MRVLHVINSLGGSGGAEHGLVREVTRFTADVDQMVVRLFEKDDLEVQLQNAGIEVIDLGLKGSRAARNWPAATLLLRRVIRRLVPDVIHSSLFTANLVGQLAGRSARTPVLSTFTLSGDVDLIRRYQPGAKSQKAAVLRRMASTAARSEAVFFRSLTQDAARTNVRALGVDPAHVTVIPRGIPLDFVPMSLKSRSELGLPPTGRLLVNIGRQAAQKGQEDLLQVLPVLDDDVHLVIVGRAGDATSAIRKTISRLALQRRVTVVGFSPDVHHILAHACLFVFPSRMEGLGTAVLEAMGAGVPVIATDIPPLREITENGSLATLVPVADTAGLVSAIRSGLENPHQHQARTAAARAWVADNYSISSVAYRVEELLGTVSERQSH